MYPNLYYFFKETFHIKIGILRFINSFGFFVALSFLVAAALLTHELRRKSKQGLFQPTEAKHVAGKPPSIADALGYFVLGFLIGFKVVALFFIPQSSIQDPQAYIFSGEGSWLAGILLGLLLAGYRWRQLKAQQLPQPKERTVRIWPHDRVGELTFIALVLGLAGAKLFDIFENWSDFLKNPPAYIFSGGGLTFYGGLICATIGIIVYARKHKMGIRYLADAIAPALMIAYAVGRIGCQVSGDGDWGIYNTAYKVDTAGKIVAAAPGEFEQTMAVNAEFVRSNPNLHHAAFTKPGALSFLPNWFFAYNYPHNVNNVGVPIPGCDDHYCSQLPAPVFPTPMYETIMGTLLFLLLWGLRDRLRPAGALFCLYLIVNGIERFLIEKIRVNNEMSLFGLHPTQAEVIALGLVLLGIGLWVYIAQKYRARPAGV